MCKEKLNLKKVGDSFFNQQLVSLVENNPYLAFVLLSAILEFMGHCYRKGQKTNDDTVRAVFFDLINNVEALKDYRQLNFKFKVKDRKSGQDIEKDNNYLYKYLRCGMLHELLPQEDIVLCPDRNDLSNSKKIVGAKNLYEDMKKAWEELKISTDISLYIENADALTIDGDFSGSTSLSIST